jgi:hypothetical protein
MKFCRPLNLQHQINKLHFCKPGGLDSRDQSRSRRLDSLRQGFENVEIETVLTIETNQDFRA